MTRQSRMPSFVRAVALVGLLASATSDAEQPTPRMFQLAAQEATKSIPEFARQANIQISAPADQLVGTRTPAIQGKLTTDEALTRLLEGTGLTFRYISDQLIAITPPKPRAAVSGASEAIRLAQSDAAPGVPGQGNGAVSDVGAESSAQAALDPSRVEIEEVLVSAQKRMERLQDVPVPVTAISGAELAADNQLRLDDYYTKVPALSLTTGQPFGSSTVSIRGIITGINQSPTVGIVVDDVPYTSSNVRGFGHVVAEVDPGDLQSIEVLRGPQGTLYGASSIGGLMKYVTIDPSMDEFSGRVQAGISGVQNGNEAGYNVRGALNVPVSDSLAMRVSAFTRSDPGYIDDPVRGADAVNSAEVTGGRIATLWRISPNLSLKLSAMLQDSDAEGNSHVDLLPGFGDLQQTTPPGSEGYSKKLQLYSANLYATLGSIDLTSVSAFTRNENTFRWDYSRRFGSLAERSFQVTGATSVQAVETEKFTQEIRLSRPVGSRAEWRFGVFYSHEDTGLNDQKLYAVNFTTGAITGDLAHLIVEDTFVEYAAFSDITYDVTDRFDIQLGVRAGWNEEELLQANSGILFGGSFPEPVVESSDSSVTYLVTPRFRLSPDVMAYARFSSGYRPGGPNVGTALSTVVPHEYGPDRTQSYELGLKAEVLDRRLSLDASVYYIDWKDIQLTLRQVLTYIANAARARSQGVELSTELRPIGGLTLSAWGAWNDAELTEDFPLTTVGAIGFSGDRLPFSSRFSGSVSAEQEFPLGRTATGFIGASLNYVGERLSVFTTSPQRARFPSYTKLDLRAGMRFGSWTANVFASNVADERGILSDAFYPNAVTYIQPRTIGMSIGKSF